MSNDIVEANRDQDEPGKRLGSRIAARFADIGLEHELHGFRSEPRAATLDMGMDAMTATPTERLRTICLTLPEAQEKEAWGDPTFRVRDKIFAMEKRGDGRISVWCKAAPGSQELLVGADPNTFFVPPYVGHKGWVGMRLDDQSDWDEVAVIVRRSYRLVAPKRLATLLDD